MLENENKDSSLFELYEGTQEQYDKLPEKAKEVVDDGYGVVVCDL